MRTELGIRKNEIFCVSLLRKAKKKKHYENLSKANVTDNKNFW